MKIILTPSNGKLAIIVDTVNGEIVREIDIPKEMGEGKNRPYGITKDNNGNWYISNWDRIGCFDSDFNLKYVINGLPENIHQIQYDEPSEELWVCATSIDSLLAIDLKDISIRRFCLITNSWVSLDSPGSDTQHFSSLCWNGSYLRVLSHKFGLEISALMTYDRGMSPRGIWRGGWESHSICEFNGYNYIIGSRDGAILGTNSMHLPIGDKSFYNAERDCSYDKGEINKHYARGMCINNRGIAVTSVFDFGNPDTRSAGAANLHIFNIPDLEKIKEINISDVGNIQDIQIYSEEEISTASDITVYQPVINKLNELITPILNGENFDSDDRMPYDANRGKPDFNRLSNLSTHLIDVAVQKNVKRLTKGIEKEAEQILNTILPQTWQRSGGFWYPEENGFMDWHTNCEAPGHRLYFVWCKEGGKSRFLTSENGKDIYEKMEPQGWSINIFYAGDKRNPFWHAVDSGGTDRISFGFKLRNIQ